MTLTAFWESKEQTNLKKICLQIYKHFVCGRRHFLILLSNHAAYLWHWKILLLFFFLLAPAIGLKISQRRDRGTAVCEPRVVVSPIWASMQWPSCFRQKLNVQQY